MALRYAGFTACGSVNYPSLRGGWTVAVTASASRAAGRRRSMRTCPWPGLAHKPHTRRPSTRGRLSSCPPAFTRARPKQNNTAAGRYANSKGHTAWRIPTANLPGGDAGGVRRGSRKKPREWRKAAREKRGAENGKRGEASEESGPHARMES